HRHVINLDISVDVRLREGHRGHIAHSQRYTVDRTDHGVADFVEVGEFAERTDVERTDTALHVATRGSRAGGAHSLYDVIHRKTSGQQAVTHYFDVDFAVEPSPYIDGADAGDLLETLADVAL